MRAPRDSLSHQPRSLGTLPDGPNVWGSHIWGFFFRTRELPTRSRVYKNPRFRRTGDYLCARGDLNPHPLIRGLAPQASASAYSATRAGDFRTFSFRCRSKQHVILYGLSGYSANRKSMFCITHYRLVGSPHPRRSSRTVSNMTGTPTQLPYFRS